MKKLLQLSAMFLVAVCFGQTPIYQFKFDNTASTSVGTGTFNYSPLTNGTGLANYDANRSNVSNKALSFNRYYGEASLSGLPAFASARTVSFWFFNRDTAVTVPVFNYGFGNAFSISITNNNQVIFTDGLTNTLTVNNTQIPQSWTHYATTYDGTLLKLFINGVLKGTLACALNTNTNNGTIELNWDTSNNGAINSNFLIDDLNIYDAALTPTQINTLFRANESQTPLAAGIPTSGLVFASQFSNGNTSDSSTTGAVISTNTSLMSAANAVSQPNNARAFDIDNTMVYDINNYPELKIGATAATFGFSVSASVKVDATYFNSLGTSQYITFFNHAGIYMRY
jgi:hypothetical protein